MVELQFIQIHGIIPAQVQEFALPFIEFHGVPVSSFPQPVKAASYVSAIIWCINYNFEFCIICKIAASALRPFVQGSNLI